MSVTRCSTTRGLARNANGSMAKCDCCDVFGYPYAILATRPTVYVSTSDTRDYWTWDPHQRLFTNSDGTGAAFTVYYASSTDLGSVTYATYPVPTTLYDSRGVSWTGQGDYYTYWDSGTRVSSSQGRCFKSQIRSSSYYASRYSKVYFPSLQISSPLAGGGPNSTKVVIPSGFMNRIAATTGGWSGYFNRVYKVSDGTSAGFYVWVTYGNYLQWNYSTDGTHWYTLLQLWNNETACEGDLAPYGYVNYYADKVGNQTLSYYDGSLHYVSFPANTAYRVEDRCCPCVGSPP